MVTRKLWRALDNYYWSEFEHGCDNEDFEHLDMVGIAYTDVYDESENDEIPHAMQIFANLKTLSFEYWLDNKLINNESHKSVDEMAEIINGSDFQSWYGDFLQYCPEDYH